MAALTSPKNARCTQPSSIATFSFGSPSAGVRAGGRCRMADSFSFGAIFGAGSRSASA